MAPHATSDLTSIPAGLTVGDIPKLDALNQARAGFIGTYRNKETRRKAVGNLNEYLAWCVRNQVNPMTAVRSQVQLYLLELEDSGLKTSTVLWKFGTVAQFYEIAVLDDLIAKDPTRGIERPSIDEGAVNRPTLRPLQLARLIEAAQERGPHVLGPVLIMAECGLRASEIADLAVERISVAEGWDVMTFVGKNGQTAESVIPVQAMRVVRICIGDRTKGPLFLNSRGEGWTRNSLWRMLKTLAVEARIDPKLVTPHALRRTMTTVGVELGVPLPVMQRQLRHKSANTLLRSYYQPKGHDTAAAHTLAAFLSNLTS